MSFCTVKNSKSFICLENILEHCIFVPRTVYYHAQRFYRRHPPREFYSRGNKPLINTIRIYFIERCEAS